MQNYFGNIIKKIREEKNITQEYLAEGICSKRQLIRIEKNQSNPTAYVLSNISKKLGNELYDFFPYSIDPNGYFIKRSLDEIMTYYYKFEHQKCYDLIANNKDLQNSENAYVKQKIGWIIGSLDNYIDINETINEEYYLDLLKLTKSFSSYPELLKMELNLQEHNIINSIIVMYLMRKEFVQAEYLLKQAIQNFERNHGSNHHPIYSKYHYNISRLFLIQKRYEEALEYSKTGIDYCKRNMNMSYLADLYNIHGRALFESGDEKQGRQHIVNYIHLRKILKPDIDYNETINDLIEHYDLKL